MFWVGWSATLRTEGHRRRTTMRSGPAAGCRQPRATLCGLVAVALGGKGDAEGCILGHGVGLASEPLQHMEPRDRPKSETMAERPHDPR